jgi:hypothetical protein
MEEIKHSLFHIGNRKYTVKVSGISPEYKVQIEGNEMDVIGRGRLGCTPGGVVFRYEMYVYYIRGYTGEESHIEESVMITEDLKSVEEDDLILGDNHIIILSSSNTEYIPIGCLLKPARRE